MAIWLFSAMLITFAVINGPSTHTILK